MILSAEEKQDLDTLFRLVDEAVVFRNQRLRVEQELEFLKSKYQTINRDCEMAAMRVEQQRMKMALALKANRHLESAHSRV